MSISTEQSVLIIAICALCTFSMRALPFLVFGNRPVPKTVRYLGRILPMAVMATLTVYCLREIGPSSARAWVPETVSLAVVILFHLWRRNTFLSIMGGTVCYMLMVQFVFA